MAHRFNLLKPSYFRSTPSNGEAVHSDEGHEKRGFHTAQTDTSVFDRQKLEILSRTVCAIEPHRFPSVIVVANATHRKNKGIVATHLASAVSNMPGQSVLLVDADFASPTLHKVFGYPEVQGLSEYLTDKKKLSELVRDTPNGSLQVLTAGRQNRSVSELLCSRKMDRFIEVLKKRCHDLVLIITVDFETVSKSSPSFTRHVDGYISVVDESALPPGKSEASFAFPGKAKLLGSIRKKKTVHPVFSALDALENDRTENTLKKESRILTSKTEEEHPVLLEKPGSVETDRFDKLTADMIKADIFKGNPVMMFTSPTSGDGKSFVSANAAASIARNTNRQVLIIDCDLRGPSLHRYFKHDNRTGLSRYLGDDRVTFSDCVRHTEIPNLFIMTAGPSVPNPLQLLSSPKMARLIDGLKNAAKEMIIVLDAAPPTLMAEGSVITRFADSVTIVVSHQKTHRNDVRKLVDMFERGKVFGVIYNHFKERQNLASIYKKYGQKMKAA
jgi:capsular exopolysaccharide synthesis family protein